MATRIWSRFDPFKDIKMALNITPRLIELTYEAVLKSFWRKEALRKFLRASYISEAHIATWSGDESKRDFLDRTFQKLQLTDKGKALIVQMSRHLNSMVQDATTT